MKGRRRNGRKIDSSRETKEALQSLRWSFSDEERMEREINTEERTDMRGMEGALTPKERILQLMEDATNGFIWEKRRVYKRQAAKRLWQPLEVQRSSCGFPLNISLCTLSSSTSLLFFHTIYLHSYFTASLVSVSFRCHLVPLPLAQVSPVQSVLACMRLCVGGLLHCYTAGAMCCLRHMFQPNN